MPVSKKRIHAPEIQDYTWCPSFIRDGVTDYLQYMIFFANIYGPCLAILRDMMAKTKTKQIVDLCSGGGGAMVSLGRNLTELGHDQTKVLFSDLYPNKKRFKQLKKSNPGLYDYVRSPVDATNIPKNIKGIFTLFTSFHHFRDTQAKAILQNAYDNKSPIAVFEFTKRNFYSFVVTSTTLILPFFLTPLIFPWRPSRFLFTYIIPLIPLVATFDVFSSIFRTREPDELRDMVSQMQSQDYEWNIGVVSTSAYMKVVYLTGREISQ